jgi:hypothetical protein
LPRLQSAPGKESYGLSGPYVTGPIPCTDPTTQCTPKAIRLNATRVIYFGPPGWTRADATLLDGTAGAPFALTFAAF